MPETDSQTAQTGPVANLPATLPSLNQTYVVKLARELVMQIKDESEILKSYRITDEQLAAIRQLDFFQRAYEAYMIEWNSATSAERRLQLISLAYIEDGLPDLAARMVKSDEDLGKCVEVGKLLTKLGGLDKQEKGGVSQGEKFVINIDLGGDDKIRLEKNITPTPPAIENGTSNEPA